MTCSVQSDLDMFPGSLDVVRVGTDRWTKCHDDVLDRLLKGVEAFLHDHSKLPFEMLLTAYEQQEPRAKVGKKQHAYILYGPSGAFFLDGGELKMDIKGLVFKPIVRRTEGNIIAEF